MPRDTVISRGDDLTREAAAAGCAEGAPARVGAADAGGAARRVARTTLLDVCSVSRAHAPLQEQLAVIDSFVTGIEEELCALALACAAVHASWLPPHNLAAAHENLALGGCMPCCGEV